VVVNVSYFFQFTDDPTIHAVGPRAVNIQRGAALLFASAEFRKLVCSGGLPAEKVGKQQTPLCSTPYKYMFNACRIPQRGQDSYRIYDPSRYTHCIVARKGHFFSMELVDGNGDPLPVSVLEEQLEQCVSLAETQPSFRAKLGILTSADRDDWADAREEFVKSGGIAMKEALQHLESGALVLNLDDEAPISRKECGELFWTGGVNSGENRWFDKSIQIMVANNGKAGLLAEHSMMDGMGVVNFSDYVTKMTYHEAKKRSRNGSGTSGGSVYEIFSDGLDAMDENTAEALEAKGEQYSVIFLAVT
jgi:carnitine O-acetyltransferase